MSIWSLATQGYLFNSTADSDAYDELMDCHREPSGDLIMTLTDETI